MTYTIRRTELADSQIRNTVLYIAERFGTDIALNSLEELEKSILSLAKTPYIGVQPRYLVLKRQGYRVLILKKNLVFYKVNEELQEVMIYAVIDHRQDYLNILKGL